MICSAVLTTLTIAAYRRTERQTDKIAIAYRAGLGGSVVERRYVTGELSLVCTGPTADG